jgi:hypothetical protein
MGFSPTALCSMLASGPNLAARMASRGNETGPPLRAKDLSWLLGKAGPSSRGGLLSRSYHLRDSTFRHKLNVN